MPNYRTTRFVKWEFAALAAWAVLLLDLLTPAFAQKASPSDVNDLTITVSARNTATVYLQVYKPHANMIAVMETLKTAFHGELQRLRPYSGKEYSDAEGPAPDIELIADWRTPAARNGLQRNGELNLAPLLKALRREGLKYLNVTIYLPKQGYAYCEGATQFPDKRGRLTYAKTLATDSKTSAVLRFGYGYSAGNEARIGGILAAVFLLPIGMGLVLRRRALTAKNVDPTAVWFGYMQATGWIQTAFWPVWVGFLIWTRASDMLDSALGISRPGVGSPGWIFLLFIPSGLIAVALAAISQPVYTRVRGIDLTPGSLVKRAAWGQAAAYLPINFTWYAFFSLSSAPQQAVMWFGASYIVRMIASNQLAKLEKFRPLPLKDGELRDYVFGLAHYAGVKLKMLILLPAGQMKEANAFASAGNNILITDYLLQNMTKREVNAIMAHEMTHLVHKHANTHQIIRGVSFYAPVFVLIIARAIFPDTVLDWPIWYPLAALCGLPVYTWFSRRDEKVADLGAAQMTGDPEAMITGLARLSKISMHPMEWGRVAGGLTSHPSTARRAEYIAAAWRIPAPRIRELLESPPDGERYEALKFDEETPKIYSAAYRQANGQRRLYLSLAGAALPLAAAGLLDQHAALSEGLILPLYILGVGVSFSVLVLAERFSAMRGNARLRPLLKEKLQAQFAPNAEAVFTGFAPEALPKSYTGNRDWDLGFLQILPNELCYTGERTQFILRRKDIVEMQLITTKTGWSPIPRLAVSWRNTEEYAAGAFNLLVCESASFSETKRTIAAFAERLAAWRNQSDSETETPEVPAFGLPFTGKAPGTDLKAQGSPAILMLMTGFLMTTAAVESALFGLHFNLTAGAEGFGAGWYVTFCAAMVAFLHWLPGSLYREPVVPPVPPVAARPPEPAPSQNVTFAAPGLAPPIPPLPVRRSEYDF